MASKPLRASEIKITLPDFVIDGVNDIIKEKYRGGAFTATQKEITTAIMRHAPEDVKQGDLADKGYLDFEKLYEEYGWKVRYDKAGYNENWYPPYFRFTPLTKGGE